MIEYKTKAGNVWCSIVEVNKQSYFVEERRHPTSEYNWIVDRCDSVRSYEEAEQRAKAIKPNWAKLEDGEQ